MSLTCSTQRAVLRLKAKDNFSLYLYISGECFLFCFYCHSSHKTDKRSLPSSTFCRLQTADCRLQTADCRLQTADSRLQTTYCRLQTTYCRLQKVDDGNDVINNISRAKSTEASFPRSLVPKISTSIFSCRAGDIMMSSDSR